MALTHNSTVREGEPTWGPYLKTNRNKLPLRAYVWQRTGTDPQSVSTWSYPHHWVVNGSKPDDKGRWTEGDMYLHEGGLGFAWAAAQGSRTGKKAPQAVIDHLQQHRRALGLDKENVQKGLAKIRILKRNKLSRVVVGVVYEPNVVDPQGHYASADTIERACHRFMMHNGVAGVGHDESISNEQIRKSAKRMVVENYIAPVDMHFGSEKIRAGSWVMGVKIFDDEEWAQVEAGKINGFSMHGEAWAKA